MDASSTMKKYVSLYRFYPLVILLILLSRQTSGQNMSFDILDGEENAEISFDYVHNFVLVDIRLFGVLPLRFIFDTGAEHTILFKREFSDMMNVSYDLRIPIVGSDQSRQLHALVARSVDIEIDGLVPQRRDILVLEENYFHLDEITGTPIHGIIGGSFFKNVVVQIDYHKQKLRLYSPPTFKTPPRSYRQIDVELASNKPYVNATLTLGDNTQLPVKLLVDTGAGLPLLLHTNTHAKLELPDHIIRGRLGMGLGGYVEGSIGRVSSLQLEDLTFEQVLTSFQDISEGIRIDSSRMRNGLLGNQILSRFDVYLDYTQRKLYLRPVFRYKRKFKIDKSGLIIFALGKNLKDFVVQDIIEGSPAEEAGIRAGDVIRRLQGLPANVLSLDHITSVLQKKAGKRIKLVIERGDQVLRVQFKLRDLI